MHNAYKLAPFHPNDCENVLTDVKVNAIIVIIINEFTLIRTFMMLKLPFLALLTMLTFALPTFATAGTVVAKVDVSEQVMNVYSNGQLAYTWSVSTARQGKHTPRGSYSANFLSRHHKSSLYNNAPMPHSIFFRGNYAIHGTNQISKLGRPASAGCIRLHPDHAAVLFQMTRNVGLNNMKIVVQN